MRQPHRLVVSAVILLASAAAVPACGSARAAEDLRTVHITIHHSAFDPDELETQLVFGRLNSERLGAYHRLDLRASHRVPLSHIRPAGASPALSRKDRGVR